LVLKWYFGLLERFWRFVIECGVFLEIVDLEVQLHALRLAVNGVGLVVNFCRVRYFIALGDFLNHSGFIFLKLVLSLRMLVQADLHAIMGDSRLYKSLRRFHLGKSTALILKVNFKDARFGRKVRKNSAQIRNQLRGTQVLRHEAHLVVDRGLSFTHLV